MDKDTELFRQALRDCEKTEEEWMFRMQEAEAECESLRQRVRELDTEYSISVETGTKLANELTAVRRKLAALKSQQAAQLAGQGEPVAWMFTDDTGMRFVDVQKPHKDYVPLYTAPTVPEGYVMVPVEPTKEMIDALALAKNSTMQGYKSLLTDTEFRNMAKAMLAAAPKPSQQAAHMPVKTYCGGKPNYCKEQE